MVGHQAVDWAEDAFTCGGVEHPFAKVAVELSRKPAAGAILEGEGPKGDGVRLVSMGLETGQVAFVTRFWGRNRVTVGLAVHGTDLLAEAR
jgi:hypothetical protein